MSESLTYMAGYEAGKSRGPDTQPPHLLTDVAKEEFLEGVKEGAKEYVKENDT